jgi:hypothetical protein
MDRRRDKEKLGLRSSKRLIHYRELQFISDIGVEESLSMLTSNVQKAVIETPKKLKDLRTKSVPRSTNFQQLARVERHYTTTLYPLHPDNGS